MLFLGLLCSLLFFITEEGTGANIISGILALVFLSASLADSISKGR